MSSKYRKMFEEVVDVITEGSVADHGAEHAEALEIIKKHAKKKLSGNSTHQTHAVHADNVSKLHDDLTKAGWKHHGLKGNSRAAATVGDAHAYSKGHASVYVSHKPSGMKNAPEGHHDATVYNAKYYGKG